jgi:hypothetical protein
MKRKFFFLFAAISALIAPVLAFAKDLPFSGEWTSVENVAGQSKPYSIFTITLNEDEAGNVHGAYCFITQGGNRVDCSSGKELNINGRVEDNKIIAAVNFYSFFGATDGMAEITVSGDWLIWNVVKHPEGGNYYGPLLVRMRKDTSAGPRPGERMVEVEKAFLYGTPSHSRGSHVYVVKGDYVKLINVSSDLRFWKVEFVAKDGRHIIRWIDCADIDFCAK